MKIQNMKIYNTIQNSGIIVQFLDQNLKIKNDKQLKHRNIMNEILWIYGITVLLGVLWSPHCIRGRGVYFLLYSNLHKHAMDHLNCILGV